MPIENLATILGPTVVGFGEFDTPANEYAKVEKVEKVSYWLCLLCNKVTQVMAMLLRESSEYWLRLLSPQQPLVQGSTPGLLLSPHMTLFCIACTWRARFVDVRHSAWQTHEHTDSTHEENTKQILPVAALVIRIISRISTHLQEFTQSTRSYNSMLLSMQSSHYTQIKV